MDAAGTVLAAGDGSTRGSGTPVEPPRQHRPRIGLALGGGSARGWSHIGAIAGLAEAGIHPEIVAGCSIGAVVGGCYAAGKLDDLTAFALSLTRRRVIGMLDVRLTGSGFIGGDRLRRRLTQELEGRRIDTLPVAFASVATELGTGHEVWLAEGSLIDAVRASYAIPGIFPPVALGGRLLMDGTLVNPVPVRLARELGADVVICVNLNCDFGERGAIVRPVAEPVPVGDQLIEEEVEQAVQVSGRWALLHAAGRLLVGRNGNEAKPGSAATSRPQTPTPGVARVMLDAFNITQDRISRARLESDPPDASITPQLAGMGLFEFHRAGECIALGRAAAEAALPAIRKVIEEAAARV